MATRGPGTTPARCFAQVPLIGKAGAGRKPGSVEGNHSSGTAVTGRLEQPTRESARDRRRTKHCNSPVGGLRFALLPYLVLLRAGFTVPRTVASRAVRSYRTFSPLPGMHPAVCFLWHFPWARALQELPGALSEGARTFLCFSEAAIAWPTPAFPDREF
jgi:hypothetical protein